MFSIEMWYHKIWNISLKIISNKITTSRILVFIKSTAFCNTKLSIGVTSFSIDGENKLV